MSVTKFNSGSLDGGSSASTTGKKSNTMNIVIGLIVVAGIAYLGYKYVYLPAQAKKRQAENEFEEQ